MQCALLHSEGSDRLLLIFAGWGMDANVFARLRRSGYDIMVVWDYTSFHIDWACTAPYREICLLAWSMGVYAAGQSVQAIEHKITRRIAINGTLKPIDDLCGIPEAVFYGTLEGLTDASVRKFQRRMCATREDFDLFASTQPSRTTDSLRAELESIASRHILGTSAPLRFDVALIGRDDRIFPFYNQRRAWEAAGVQTAVLDCGHFTDFQPIIDAHLIDKTLVGRRFRSGSGTYDENTPVQADAIDRVMTAIRSLGLHREIAASHNAVLEIGSGSGMLSRRIAAMVDDPAVIMWDLAADMPADMPPGRRYVFRNCDAELAIDGLEPDSLDHIFSASTIQWFNSPARFMQSIARALRSGGCAVFTTYVRGNMHQISDITGVSLPLLTPDEWLSLANGKFDVLYATAYTRDLDFESPRAVLHHMRLSGVNSLGSPAHSGAMARRLLERYPMMLDGRYHLTYKPFIFILRKK